MKTQTQKTYLRAKRPAWEAQRERALRPAFSLMEVLFAVMILTLGLIFVAAQFPMGLATSRQIAEITQDAVNANNAQVMIELQLASVDPDLALEPQDHDMVVMHPLVKPNILSVDLVDGIRALVIDDIEYLGPYLDNRFNDIQWPFWSPLVPVGDTETTFYVGEIGGVMSPPVVESDSNVQRLLDTWGVDPTDLNYEEELYKAIYDISLDRKYSWGALYHNHQEIFYIFTFRNFESNVRYAMQTDETAYTVDGDSIYDVADPYSPSVWPSTDLLGQSPMPAGPDNDRVFPVFWRVFLDDETMTPWDSSVVGTRFYLKDDGTGMRNRDGDDNIIAGPAIFTVNAYVAAILRPGSIIIDADPYRGDDGNRATTKSGDMYEVDEIWLGEEAWNVSADPAYQRYYVKLKSHLRDDLHCFWVVPPPIVRNESDYEFAEQQPVVNVTMVNMPF